MSGRPRLSTIASSTGCAPSSRNVLWGNDTHSGVAKPAFRISALASGLFHALRQPLELVPTNGTPTISRMVWTDPFSPAPPCKATIAASGLSSRRRSSNSASVSHSCTVRP